jgi:hypothetical protein
MIKVKGKTLPKVRDASPTLDWVDGADVAEALGAQALDTPGPKAQGPVALFGLRQALAARLRSTGGRPSLGVSRRQKIPLDDADWELLCKLAEILADDESRPTPGQVASELLHERLRQVVEDSEHAGSDDLRRTFARPRPKRAANG